MLVVDMLHIRVVLYPWYTDTCSLMTSCIQSASINADLGSYKQIICILFLVFQQLDFHVPVSFLAFTFKN